MMTLDMAFQALADPPRRAILAQGEATVGELACPFDISLPAISRHLKVLAEASLITNQRAGKCRYCRLNDTALTRASDWFDRYRHFWSGSFDRLEAHLKKNSGGKR